MITDKELSEVIADLTAENAELRGLLSTSKLFAHLYLELTEDKFLFIKCNDFIQDIKRVLENEK